MDVDTVRDAENLIYYVVMAVFAIRQTKLGGFRFKNTYHQVYNYSEYIYFLKTVYCTLERATRDM